MPLLSVNNTAYLTGMQECRALSSSHHLSHTRKESSTRKGKIKNFASVYQVVAALVLVTSVAPASPDPVAEDTEKMQEAV